MSMNDKEIAGWSRGKDRDGDETQVWHLVVWYRLADCTVGRAACGVKQISGQLEKAPDGNVCWRCAAYERGAKKQQAKIETYRAEILQNDPKLMRENFYALFCQKCHGFAGEPKVGPRSVTLAKNKREAWRRLRAAALEHEKVFHEVGKPDVRIRLLVPKPIDTKARY